MTVACRRARVGQGRAFGGAEEAPSLTDAARDGEARCGRDRRMLAARVEQKNEQQSMTKNGVYHLDKESSHTSRIACAAVEIVPFLIRSSGTLLRLYWSQR